MTGDSQPRDLMEALIQSLKPCEDGHVGDPRPSTTVTAVPASPQMKRRGASLARKAREASERADVLTAERDEWIRKARAEGESLRAIGTVVGLSQTAVANILRKGQPRR